MTEAMGAQRVFKSGEGLNPALARGGVVAQKINIGRSLRANMLQFLT